MTNNETTNGQRNESPPAVQISSFRRYSFIHSFVGYPAVAQVTVNPAIAGQAAPPRKLYTSFTHSPPERVVA